MGLFTGLIVGVISGLVGFNVQQERVIPNQGIRQSAKNSAILLVVGFLITFVSSFLFNLYCKYTNPYITYENLLAFLNDLLKNDYVSLSDHWKVQ